MKKFFSSLSAALALTALTGWTATAAADPPRSATERAAGEAQDDREAPGQSGPDAIDLDDTDPNTEQAFEGEPATADQPNQQGEPADQNAENQNAQDGQDAQHESQADHSADHAEEGKAGLGVMVTDSQDGEGVTVQDVHADSPAAQAGIGRGDVILSVNGQDFASTDEFIEAIRSMNPEEEVNLEIRRANGEETSLTAKLETRETALSGDLSEEQLAAGQDEQGQRQRVLRPQSDPQREGQQTEPQNWDDSSQQIQDLQQQVDELNQKVQDLEQQFQEMQEQGS